MTTSVEWTREGLTQFGFGGFTRLLALGNPDCSPAPAAPGVYVVLRESERPADFLTTNPGGRFKDRDPTVPVELLKLKWVESRVVYIGRGGNLRSRLKQYAEFGAGKPTGHWGGRYVWQLRDADGLLVAWKEVDALDEAAAAEVSLIVAFRRAHGGRLPFANLVQPRWHTFGLGQGAPVARGV